MSKSTDTSDNEAFIEETRVFWSKRAEKNSLLRMQRKCRKECTSSFPS